jgi:hypothetical protein
VGRGQRRGGRVIGKAAGVLGEAAGVGGEAWVGVGDSEERKGRGRRKTPVWVGKWQGRNRTRTKIGKED